jgi:type I restriction enzyme S subunit
MSFPRYPKYKASGVEWLGEVPEHWEVKPIRKAAHLESGHTPSRNHPEYWENCTVPWFTLADVWQIREEGRDVIVETKEKVSELGLANSAARRLPAGTVMLSRTASVGFSAIMGVEMATTQDFANWVCGDGLLPKFLLHVCRSMQGEFRRLMMGSTHNTIYMPDIQALRFALPPLAEQRAIAAFLDRETKKIDELVAEQERLIELLKEKRQAVISHAVTKGLDPAAPMKPSGVEWLGDVPAHWEVKPIRKAARLESGHTPSRNHPEYWVDCTVPWFTLADVWQIREEGRDVIIETKEKVSELGLANSAARRLPPGTVMLSRTASVGFSAIMGVEMATTQDFANWVCGEHLESKFLLHVFRAMRGEFTRLMMGSTHNTIYMPDIEAFRFAQPPRTEQRAIAALLDRETKKIDDLTAQAESSISLLTERRSALISAAVTGQIDVRNAVPSANPTEAA